MNDTAHDLRALAQGAKAWPFKEAAALLKRLGGETPARGYALFETGYGPSGLPHIGTFGEVARTTMVRRAFAVLSDMPTRLVAFSDDMDALRKVPENIPARAMVEEHLGKPLTQIPDPFGTHESFGAHNNARLRASSTISASTTRSRARARLIAWASSTARSWMRCITTMRSCGLSCRHWVRSGRRPTAPFCRSAPRPAAYCRSPSRRATKGAGTVSYVDEDGETMTVPVTGGHCKLQWKADWAMRWHSLGVDYEMAGKDLISSVEVSGKICRALGSTPPAGFIYELFLDENSEKISKSRGNGLAIEEWLAYGSRDSLSLYMYTTPRRAKRLYFDVIPRHVDDHLTHLAKYPEQGPAERLESPAWHIHAGHPPAPESGLSYGVLLNLASVCNTEDPTVLWGFISRYVPGAAPETAPILAELVGHALTYYRDVVKPTKAYRTPPAGGAGGARRPTRRARGVAGRRGRRGDPDGGLRGRQAPSFRIASRLVPRALRDSSGPEPGAPHGLLHRALWFV